MQTILLCPTIFAPAAAGTPRKKCWQPIVVNQGGLPGTGLDLYLADDGVTMIARNLQAPIREVRNERADTRAKRATSTAASPVCLPPNPPPVSGKIAQIYSARSPSAAASPPQRPQGFSGRVDTLTGKRRAPGRGNF
jgi:hypothetical protein